MVEKGATLLLDVYGEPLLHALDLPVEVCKPNEEEIRVLPVSGVDAALRFMAAKGVKLPVVSQGEKGMRFLIGGRIGTERKAVERPRFLVGAGDDAMAGLAVALRRGLSPREAIRQAVAMAAAHVEG